MLDELPAVCAIGESVHLWQRSLVEDERCGCGLPFSQCEFWGRVGEAQFGGWAGIAPARVARLRATVDRNRFIPLLAAPGLPAGFRHALDEYLAYYLRLYSAVGQVSGCDLIVDSSKHPSLAFCLRRATGLDVRVVHMVRDSRAVAFSWTKDVGRPDTTDDSRMPTLQPLATAARWSGHNAVLDLLGHTKTPTLRIRYEDFARAPAATLSAITTFASLSTSEEELGFLGDDRTGQSAGLTPAHTVSGNPIRFSQGPVRIRPDVQWRTALPVVQRRLVTAATLPLLLRYGYLSSANADPGGN